MVHAVQDRGIAADTSTDDRSVIRCTGFSGDTHGEHSHKMTVDLTSGGSFQEIASYLKPTTFYRKNHFNQSSDAHCLIVDHDNHSWTRDSPNYTPGSRS